MTNEEFNTVVREVMKELDLDYDIHVSWTLVDRNAEQLHVRFVNGDTLEVDPADRISEPGGVHGSLRGKLKDKFNLP